MKFQNLAIPALAIIGVAIFGVALAALFADGSLFATEPSSDPAPRDILLPDPAEKLQPAAPLLTLPSNPQLSTASTRPEPKAADTESVYTWEDGDRTLRVVLQDDLTVQSNSVTGPDDDVVAKGSKTSIVQTSGNRDGTSIPVFRSESGGGLMTLPGGVLLALDPELDKAAIASFFTQNNISPDKVSELDFIDNGFFIQTEPGFPSLELANSLAGQGRVLISSPNWSRQLEAK